MARRNIDDINEELEQLISFTENGGGFGDPDAEKAHESSVLSGKLDDRQRESYRNLYAGMMAVFRNRYAHRIVDPSPEVGGAIIAFIDLLLKTLDDIDWGSNEGEAL